MLNRVSSICRNLFLKQAVERDLEDELRSTLEILIAQKLKDGIPLEVARREAALDLGGLEQVKEEIRFAKAGRWLEDFLLDIRFGMRLLKSNPGFATLAIMTLGAALGASAVMFSIINGVLMLPLPYNDADRLICIYSTSSTNHKGDLKAADFVSLKNQSRSFEGLAGIDSRSNVTLSDRGLPDLIEVAAVNEEFFRIFDGKAVIGRILQSGDFGPGRDSDSDRLYDGSVAVFSYRFWQSRYGGDRSVVGQTVSMNGKPVLIVGIAAPDFQFVDVAGLRDAVCWVPRVFGGSERYKTIKAIGKVRRDTDINQAQAEMDVLATRLFPKEKDTSAVQGISLVSLHESVIGKVRPRLLVLFGAVILVLMIACSNVVNLLLVRAAGRYKEMALRSSIGASRLRLFRQLLTESVLLSLLGGTAGLLIAAFSRSTVLAMAPSDLPRLGMIAIDFRTFGFTFLIALVTGMFCGVFPALRGSELDLASALKQGTQGNVPIGRNWLGASLIAGQIAMALVLLIASGLLLQTYVKLQSVPLNFDARNILIINATPPHFKPEYANARMADRVNYIDALLTQIRKVPGVECAAVGELPIQPKRLSFTFFGAGILQLYPEGQPSKNLIFSAITTSPDYFRVIRARLLAGRLPGLEKQRNTEYSTVVNEVFAHKTWPGSDPIGKKLVLKRGDKTETFEVVGLIADTRNRGLETEAVPAVYMPLAHNPGFFSGSMLVRCAIDPETVVSGLRKTLLAVDKDAALGRIELVERVLDSHYAVRRFNLFLISIFGVLAFFLAVIGIFGTVACSASRRTHEIGIRMALGAHRTSVLSLIVRQGLWMLALGEAAGLAASLLLNQLLSSMVFGITTTDPVTYLMVSLTWAAVVISACLLPAFHASRVDPIIALRCE